MFDTPNNIIVSGKGWGQNMTKLNMIMQEFGTSAGNMSNVIAQVSKALKTDEESEFEDQMLEVYMNLPGADVLLPCPHCGEGSELTEVIIELNDTHKWSREAIADWVDNLHDSGFVDLSFKEKDDRS